MDLRCLGEYRGPNLCMLEGETTERLDLSEATKKDLYYEFPGLFSIIGEDEPEFNIKNPEENLRIRNKGGRPRKQI